MSDTDQRVVLADAIFDAWRLPLLSPEAFWALADSGALSEVTALSEQQLRYLSQFAVLAPSTHNTVPLRLHLDAAHSALDVCIAPKDILPQSDAKGRQAAVSVGCALANLELAASALGLSTTLVTEAVPAELLLPAASDGAEHPVKVARVTFQPAPAASTPWLKLMLEHKVVRAEYDRAAALPPEARAEMLETVERIHPRLQLHVLEQSLVLRTLGKFQEQADRYVFENRRFASELGQWLLPNDERSNARAMRGHEFGFDDAFAEQVHTGLLGSGALLPDQIATFARGGRAGLESSSAVLVLTTSDDSLEQRLAAGRAAQHLSLQLQQQGFCSAFHAALTEVEWVSKMFAATVLRTTRRPMVLLRVGKVKRPADLQRPHAARPQLDEILLSRTQMRTPAGERDAAS